MVQFEHDGPRWANREARLTSKSAFLCRTGPCGQTEPAAGASPDSPAGRALLELHPP